MVEILIFLIIYPLLLILIAVWARRWGRSGIIWALIAFFLSPLIAALVLLIFGKNAKSCPECAEPVQRKAAICKHCGYRFAGMSSSSS